MKKSYKKPEMSVYEMGSQLMLAESGTVNEKTYEVQEFDGELGMASPKVTDNMGSQKA